MGKVESGNAGERGRNVSGLEPFGLTVLAATMNQRAATPPFQLAGRKRYKDSRRLGYN